MGPTEGHETPLKPQSEETTQSEKKKLENKVTNNMIYKQNSP